MLTILTWPPRPSLMLARTYAWLPRHPDRDPRRDRVAIHITIYYIYSLCTDYFASPENLGEYAHGRFEGHCKWKLRFVFFFT